MYNPCTPADKKCCSSILAAPLFFRLYLCLAHSKLISSVSIFGITKRYIICMKSKLILLVVFGISIFGNSCKKGDTGPAGLTGPAGPTGATGSANVIYSAWTNLTFTGSGTFWSAQITAPGVTQDIMDKGVVKTYFKFGTSVYEGNYSNLTLGSNTTLYQYLTLGTINLRATFNASYPWRYVIIPGGVAGGRLTTGGDAETFVFADGSSMHKADFDKLSYEDICNRFSIPTF